MGHSLTGSPSVTAVRVSPIASLAGWYADLLARPFTFLAGQVLTFFGISLYVKLVQMRHTAEYSVGWIESGRFFSNCRDYVLFCGQEVLVFAVLLLIVMAWHRWNPTPRRSVRWVMWTLAWLTVPLASLVEVLGLAHFAFFLTPLGPEEVRQIAWTRHVVSASNVLGAPEVALGLLLTVGGYYLVPTGLWLRRLRGWPRRRRAVLVGVLVGGLLAVSLPKPRVTEALLVPHPLLWLLLGSRGQPAWADTGASVIGPLQSVGRSRYVVTERPRNVLIVVLESTRASSVALYRPEAKPGRELLRWRDEIVTFDHVYAAVPTSAHALFSLLYGIYPYLGPFWSASDKAVVAESMAEHFTRAGFDTQLYSTSDLNFDDVRSYGATGFQRVLDPNDWPGQESFAMLPWGRDDRLLTDEVKRFLAAPHPRPFFVLAMTNNPHHPYAIDQLPGQSAIDDPHDAYERLVEYNLHLVADLYEWMKQTGVAEHTLLLVLGDHGEAFGEHAGNFGHAAFIYEENVHIPCFIMHPRRLGLPHHITQLGSQVDLRATVLDILGRQDSAPGDGMSLLREDSARVIANFTENGVSRFGLRDAHYTFIYNPQGDAGHLYDRRSDPGEAYDLSRLQPELAAGYLARLRRWEAWHQMSLARVLR